MELPLPEDELFDALVDLVLPNDPPWIDVVVEVLADDHEHLRYVRTHVPAFLLELADALPFAIRKPPLLVYYLTMVVNLVNCEDLATRISHAVFVLRVQNQRGPAALL